MNDILSRLSFEEKALLLAGAGNMSTYEITRLGIKPVRMADGPHGIRRDKSDNCTAFPSLCAVGATWNTELVYELGQALAEDCIQHNVDLILGPGANIKRTPRCGRNFEYISEDPVLIGEIAAAYINGVQSKGVGTCLKHFALSNQEKFRTETSAEVDIRVLHEIYLKGFEIAIKKSQPHSVMCSYNKVHSIWASENKYLLNDVLKEQWGYDGCVISDWGAVRDICKAVMAGLHLKMPPTGNIVEELKAGLDNGAVTMERIDAAVEAVLRFVQRIQPMYNADFDRDEQHRIAQKVATESIVLLKNTDRFLPLKKGTIKKIGVIGEYAEKPLIGGQGSAEVYADAAYIDVPLDEIRKRFGDDVEVKYLPVYSRRCLPDKMLWTDYTSWEELARDCDVILVFAGSMESEDTEQFDRNTIEINPNIDYVIDIITQINKNVAVILQSGSALALSSWTTRVPAILQMWLGGEGAGSAIADVLTGTANPSGKLSETFPTAVRTDCQYPGDGLKVVYNEGFDVGYRYYDKHPEEIIYPFGHGLSYTDFEYSDYTVYREGDVVKISYTVKNNGTYDGGDATQIYVAKPVSCVTRCVKELKAFNKVFLKAGESKTVFLTLPLSDLAYYNLMLQSWIVEPGEYTFMLAQSARDIKLTETVDIDVKTPYTINSFTNAIVG